MLLKEGKHTYHTHLDTWDQE